MAMLTPVGGALLCKLFYLHGQGCGRGLCHGPAPSLCCPPVCVSGADSACVVCTCVRRMCKVTQDTGSVTTPERRAVWLETGTGNDLDADPGALTLLPDGQHVTTTHVSPSSRCRFSHLGENMHISGILILIVKYFNRFKHHYPSFLKGG